MRAFINAAGDDLPAGLAAEPTPLRAVLDVPMLQLVIERLVTEGVKRFDVAVCADADRVEARIGDGARWGVSIRWHLVRDPRRPFDAVRRLERDDGEWWIASGDRLPQVDLHAVAAHSLLGRAEGSRWRWSGWARVAGPCLRALPPSERAASLWLRRAGATRTTAETWDVRTPRGRLSANRDALSAPSSATLMARLALPGLWIGRGAVIDPGARLRPPAYIGRDTLIARDAVVGPHAIVGSGCVVDEGAQVEDAVVDADTYVGAGIEVREALVSRRHLHNLALDAALDIPDAHLLGDLRSAGWRARLDAIGSRALGVLLTAALLPAVLYARRSPARYGILSRLPQVARGDLRLVGRRPDVDVDGLPPDWRAAIEGTPVGLITPHAALAHDAEGAEGLALDTWYATHRTMRLDASLLAAWMRRRVRG